jgi:hypothetical protein
VLVHLVQQNRQRDTRRQLVDGRVATDRQQYVVGGRQFFDYLLLRRMKSLIKEFNNMEKPSRPFFVVPFVSFRLQQFPEFYEDEPIVSKQELRAMQADTKKLAEFLIQKTEA